MSVESGSRHRWPNLVDSMERHGHLSIDPAARERLLSASAGTGVLLMSRLREGRAVR